MPKRKTTETDIPAAEVPASPKPRKTAAKPKASATVHKHTRKASKPAEAEVKPSVVPKATAVTEPEPVKKVVTQEEIASLAYSYWEKRGFQGGSPSEDWLRAERELLVLA